MQKMNEEFVMKHKANKVNLFRQKTNKNLSISTTTTSNSQNKPNEKLIKKNSLALNNTNDINEKDDNELNDTLLEEYLETEGKRILTKLSESVQTTKNGHIIINSKRLLTKDNSKENTAFVFDRMLSNPNKTKITKKISMDSNAGLMHKKQISVLFSPPIKKKNTMSSNTSNNITIRSNSNTAKSNNTNRGNNKATKNVKKKSNLLLNNLTSTNSISCNDKIAYLINNTDTAIAPQIKKAVHMKTTSVACSKATLLNKLTSTNKNQKKRNTSGSFNVSHISKPKNTKHSRTQLISALY